MTVSLCNGFQRLLISSDPSLNPVDLLALLCPQSRDASFVALLGFLQGLLGTFHRVPKLADNLLIWLHLYLLLLV